MRYSILLTVLCLFLLPSFLPAEVPLYINYQGRLTDSLGLAVPDDDYDITFGIWNAMENGDKLWSDDFIVKVTEGLFSCELGPLPDDLFAKSGERWLSIEIVGARAELSPRTKITSGAYAFHALRADTADYVYGGSGDNGWVDDGSVVRLKSSNDSVGIGTSSPEAKLHVNGNMITDTLTIGSYLQSGYFYFPASLTPNHLTIGESASGTVQMRFRDAATYTSLGLYHDTDGGGYIYVNRDTAINRNGFVVDGNYNGTENTLVKIEGHDRTVIFDMNADGDSSVRLPDDAINEFEIENEAGIGSGHYTGSTIAIGPVWQSLTMRMMSFPTDGHVLVIATGSFIVDHMGDYETLYFGVSESSLTVPTGDVHTWSFENATPNGLYYDSKTVHKYFEVEAGVKSFYFVSKFDNDVGTAGANNIELSVLFFPTWYGYTFVPPGDNPDGDYGVMTLDQIEMDRRIEARINAREEKLRREFDAKLEEIRAEIEKQTGNK